MAEKELRRLKRRELLQMLLVQCEETERLSQETEEIKERMEAVMQSYERLKKKLDIKDERLNQKDNQIADLKRKIEEMKSAEEAEQAAAVRRRPSISRNWQVVPIQRRRTDVEQIREDGKETRITAAAGDLYG